MVFGLILFGLVIGAAVYLALRLYAGADASRLATAVNASAIGLTVLGAILLLMRARVGVLLIAVAGGSYAVAYLHALWQGRGGLGGSRGGTAPPILTKYLNVVRDANTGRFYGTVLAGSHRGRRLTELSLEQLLEVRQECHREDPDAVPLIEAFIDQSHGPGWRDQDTPPQQ